MSLQTIELHSVIVTFDKEKTKNHRTEYNKPCDCQDCRNYYKHIGNTPELVEFLRGFGIDYYCTEEVCSFDWGNNSDSLIHHEGYYGVFGRIEGDEFNIERFGVKITFAKGASVPCDRKGEYFWICIEGDFQYILDEKRELPNTFSRKIEKFGFVKKLKAIFKK